MAKISSCVATCDPADLPEESGKDDRSGGIRGRPARSRAQQCQAEEGSSLIFHEPWWLDAAAPGEWQEARVMRNGHVVGRWPYCVYERYGARIVGMAPFTPTIGPWLHTPDGSVVARRRAEAAIIYELFRQMPRYHFFRQILPPVLPNMLPYQYLGFTIGLEHTLEIDCREDLAAIWAGFQDKLRNQIRNSWRREQIVECVDVDEFLSLYRDSMNELQRKVDIDETLFRRVHAACRRYEAGTLIGARDANGNLSAALFVVYSKERMHQLLQVRHPLRASPGAVDALMWHAMNFAHELKLIYDFEGIPNPLSASRQLRYGGRLGYRFILTHGWPLLLGARTMLKSMAFRHGMANRFC